MSYIDLSQLEVLDRGDNFIIQKSIPLLSIWQSPLTLAEFKILDAYLARINSHDPANRRVRFSKGELESLLGVTRINLRDLEKRIQHLGIMIKVADLENGFTSIALFEEATCTLDNDGQWQVELQCTQQAMRYIFNIDNLGYLRYRLRSIVRLTSRYSYLLFLYLEQNRFRSPWEASVDEVREYLGCTSDFYRSYSEFNKNILRRCQKELLEKTPCRFSYTPIRHSRAVKRLRFVLDPILELYDTSQNHTKSIPDIITETAQFNSIDSIIEKTSDMDFLKSALCMPGAETAEFSEVQLREIFSLLSCVPLSKLPSGPGCIDITMQWYHYLNAKFAELNRRTQTQGIKNRHNYFIAMLKADIGSDFE